MGNMMWRLLEYFGVQRFVKIPGRNLGNLNASEVARMIDAHFAGDTDEFIESALDEFLLMDYKSPFLMKVKADIRSIQLKYATPEDSYGLETEGGSAELRILADTYRGMGI